MTEQERQNILALVKTWFATVIIPKHIENTKKLSNPKEFDINPFLVPYIATYMTGELTAESVAKALVYPRVFGQSISTSFGQNIQNLISQVFKSYGSMVPGLDIEFIDAIDGRKKYCQIKLGPNTINKDDVETIHNHFRKAKNLGKTNNLPVQQHDLVVGILYGEPGQESSHYKNLRDSHDYTLLTAKDFWHHLTGDENFYNELKKAIAEVASEAKGVELINQVVLDLSKTDLIKKLAGL
ncbi:MAG: PmeII family type II restriction endonuclease [Pseudomonadota bacterium]